MNAFERGVRTELSKRMKLPRPLYGGHSPREKADFENGRVAAQNVEREVESMIREIAFEYELPNRTPFYAEEDGVGELIA